jgi:hypothetical protein
MYAYMQQFEQYSNRSSRTNAFCFFFWKKKDSIYAIRGLVLFFLKKEPKTVALRGFNSSDLAFLKKFLV